MKDRFIKLLNYSKLNKKNFAEKIGVTQVGLNNYINNERIPTTEILIKIKQSFNEISLDWLLTGKPPMLLSEQNQPVAGPVNDKYVTLLEEKLEDKQKQITLLEENKALLLAENERLKAENQALKSAQSMRVNQSNQPNQPRPSV